jgi:DNA-binding winged helix-turn-helix (wHTH) protein/TolB-like protein/Tfp pilus assembly protein PilF
MNDKNGCLRGFGKFRLDAEKRVLWFEDKPVNLPLKEIELLCVLTEKGGEVITKNELLDRVWADSFVEESNLSRHIYILRKTFRDLGAKDLIQTVPRRGYRFAGELREVPGGQFIFEKHTLTRTLIEIEENFEEKKGRKKDAEKGRRGEGERRRKTFPAVLLLLIAAVAFLGGLKYWDFQNSPSRNDSSGIRSIAVLPFKTIESNKENEHQGLGLADILITRLSNIRSLKVRPVGAVSAFENQAYDLPGVGRKLQVDAVLEGTIFRSNGNVRITLRLIRISDQTAIWTGQFERSAADEFQLQNEIAIQTTDALTLNLNRGERNALTKSYTENADAYRLYLKGRYEWSKRTWAGNIEAERLFRNAIEKDPNFTLAYVGLADSTATWASPNHAISAVGKALELDPFLAEAHATLGFLKMFHYWNWEEAESELKRSIELNPNYAPAHHWYAELLAIQGRHEEAKAEMRRALEINPVSHNYLADLGQIYYFNREYDEAQEYCRKALEIYPDFVFANEYLNDIYLKTGRYDEAVEQELRVRKVGIGFANEPVERKKVIEEDFSRMRRIYREGGITKFVENLIGETNDPSSLYVMGTRYAFLGRKEKALDALEKASQGRGFLTAFIKADPVFDNLRDEPRYRNILREMKLDR